MVLGTVTDKTFGFAITVKPETLFTRLFTEEGSFVVASAV